MKFSHLVPKRSGTSVHYHFRSKIPKDLVSYFGGRKQFQISLHDVSNRDTYLVSQTLKNLVQGIYSDIRNGMKDLTLEDIKEILRIEVRKSILFSHQVNEGSNKHTERGVLKGLEYILDLEKKLQQKVDEDLGSYRKEIEEKLEGILNSLDIRVQKSSVEFKKLRNRFIDLYLMRTSWIKELINNTGKSDDDFRREVDEKLNMNLFPELSEKLTPIIENFIQSNSSDFYIDIQFPLQILPYSEIIIPIVCNPQNFGLITNEACIESDDISPGTCLTFSANVFEGNLIAGNLSGTLPAGEYEVSSSIYVQDDDELTILPGTKFLFHQVCQN